VSDSDEIVRPRCRAFDDDYDRLHKSRKQESRIAGIVGGKCLPGSGNKGVIGTLTASSKKAVLVRNAMPGGFGRANVSQGDVSQDDFLIEAKRTDARSIRVEDDWLLKISAQAGMAGKFPAVAIEIGGMSNLVEKDWFVIPGTLFRRLQKLIKGTK
jgi:hypothetical protein